MSAAGRIHAGMQRASSAGGCRTNICTLLAATKSADLLILPGLFKMRLKESETWRNKNRKTGTNICRDRHFCKNSAEKTHCRITSALAP